MSSCFGLTKVTVALDWYINPDHAPLLAAQTRGFFRENGLDVTFIEPTQSATARNLVASGQATIGLDYEPEALIAISKGLPIQIVGILVPTPLSCVTVLKSSGIQNLAGLKGQTLGYSGDPLDEAFLNAELVHAGLNPGDVKLVPIQMDLSQALLSKTVTAVSGMMRNVEPVMLSMRGIQTTLFYPEQNGIPSYSELVFITSTHADPKTTKAFLEAVAEGVAYVKGRPAEAWGEAAQNYKNELATSSTIANENQEIWLKTLPYFANNPSRVSASQMQALKAFLIQQGVIAK